MKKIILSLGALLAVGVASAQSYPKQPDKTVVSYTSHQKAAPQVKTANEKAANANVEQLQQAKNDEAQATNNGPAVVSAEGTDTRQGKSNSGKKGN
jgi:hypothetical protein